MHARGRWWTHGLVVGLLVGAVFAASPTAQNYVWSSINGVPYAPGLILGRVLVIDSTFQTGGIVGSDVAAASGAGFTIRAGKLEWYNTAKNRVLTIGPAALQMNAGYKISWTSDPSDAEVANDLLLGRDAAATLQLGTDVNGSAVAQTLKAHDGITGTDIAGANLILAAGRGTGAGTPGTLAFQVSSALGTGTTAQTLATVGAFSTTGGFTFRADIEAVTVTKTTAVADSGDTFTNTGDGDGAAITLMNDPTAGIFHDIIITAAQTLTITPSTGESLYLNGAACGVSITSATVGSSLRVRAATGGNGGIWVATSTGTWACNS